MAGAQLKNTGTTYLYLYL